MEWLLRVFASAVVRRIAVVVVALLLAAVGIGRAHAQDYSACYDVTSPGGLCPDEGVASQMARATVERVLTQMGAGYKVCGPDRSASNRVRYYLKPVDFSCSGSDYGQGFRDYPAGKSCADRPDTYAGYTLQNSEFCDTGCTIKLDQNAPERYRMDVPNNGELFVGRGKYKATGGVCTVAGQYPQTPADRPKKDDPPKDDYCSTLVGGYKMCLNSKGQHCVTSPKTGRTYCGPSVGPITGVNPQRTEGVSTSQAAPTPGLPSSPPTARPGEDWQPGAKGSVTNQVTNNTTNTTVYNNAGAPNTGGNPEPGDGSDNPGQGDGEDDGDKGSASGGQGCSAPPTCSGDPIACATLNQGWLNRCGETKGDADGDGRPDWTKLGAGEGDEGVTPDGTETVKEWAFPGLDMLDDSGFIGGSCPAFPPLDFGPLGQFDANTDFWCDTIEILGAVFLFVFAAAALAVLVS